LSGFFRQEEYFFLIPGNLSPPHNESVLRDLPNVCVLILSVLGRPGRFGTQASVSTLAGKRFSDVRSVLSWLYGSPFSVAAVNPRGPSGKIPTGLLFFLISARSRLH
jgi:hypothetical protein